MNTFVAILFLCSLALCVQADFSCGTLTCTPSEQCCDDTVTGYRCYDPTLYDCVGGTVLCGKGEGACGTICYDKTGYHCSNGELEQGPAPITSPCNTFSTYASCTQNDPSCGWCSYYDESTRPGTCYNTTTQSCCDPYGDDCYNPIVCNNTDSCCVPYYDCEYSGNLGCCGPTTKCCSARHETLCCAEGTVCCSPNTLYVACCQPTDICCGGPPNDYETWCCPNGTQCSSTGGECM